MNVKPDGQEETREIRGTQGQGEYISHPNFDSISRPQSPTDGIESVRTHRDDGQTRNDANSSREGIAGKMLRQLIGDYRDQLANKKQEVEQLANRITELEKLQQEIDITK